jgi:pimeloyl-ACP methyl ester carboxylesterase
MELYRVTSKDGTSIGVWRTGSGPPLLLVHGTTADHSRWIPVLPELSERFTVHAMDRRGRGSSADGPSYALEREYEDVAAVVDAQAEPVHLLGHSHGAMCALEAALLTSNIRKLIAYEPPMAVSPPPAVIDSVEHRLNDNDADGAVEEFLTKAAGIPADQVAFMRTLPSWQARVGAAATIPRELRMDGAYVLEPKRFAAIASPVLFLLGSESTKPFRDATYALADAIPDAAVVELAGQSHVAIDTARELFLSEVLPFLTA